MLIFVSSWFITTCLPRSGALLHYGVMNPPLKHANFIYRNFKSFQVILHFQVGVIIPSSIFRHSSVEQIPDKLTTLSGLPTSYFTTLLNLELVKQRNRQATALPDDAQNQTNLPFFLPILETNKGLSLIEEDKQASETAGIKKANRKRRGMFDVDTRGAIEPVPGLSTSLTVAKDKSECKFSFSLLGSS